MVVAAFAAEAISFGVADPEPTTSYLCSISEGSTQGRKRTVMEFAHHAIDAFAILSVIAVVAIVLIFVYWPSNKARFDKAAESILRDEDRPWSRDRRHR